MGETVKVKDLVRGDIVDFTLTHKGQKSIVQGIVSGFEHLRDNIFNVRVLFGSNHTPIWISEKDLVRKVS
jgi:hypothetical protein